MNYKDVKDGDVFVADLEEKVCTIEHVFDGKEIEKVTKRRLCIAEEFTERFGCSSGMGFKPLGWNQLLPMYRATNITILEEPPTWDDVHIQSCELQQTAEYMRMKLDRKKEKIG